MNEEDQNNFLLNLFFWKNYITWNNILGNLWSYKYQKRGQKPSLIIWFAAKAQKGSLIVEKCDMCIVLRWGAEWFLPKTKTEFSSLSSKGSYLKCYCSNDVQLVKSIHQYFRFFRKERSVLWVKSWAGLKWKLR